MHQTGSPLQDVLGDSAAEASAMLRMLANEHRLLVLCTLIAEGESPVGQLARRAKLSQPAMSQHLAKLRDDGLVATRRVGTRILYRIDDIRVTTLIGHIKDVFCAAPR
jgi:DNA-binding transcriptional ArsR family regulator